MKDIVLYAISFALFLVASALVGGYYLGYEARRYTGHAVGSLFALTFLAIWFIVTVTAVTLLILGITL